MFRQKRIIITSLLLTAFGLIAKAQTSAVTPLEGGTYTYTCNGITEGANYNFFVSANSDGTEIYGDALTVEFDFIGSTSGVIGGNGIASTQILWNEGASLTRYHVWLEVSISGCSNTIRLEVIPQLNNRSIGFDVVASNECFSPGGNGFDLPVSFLGNDGESLAQNQFPVKVEFTVNGTAYQQIMQSATDSLQIENTMFAANPAEDMQVLVEITGATDAHSAEISPGEDNSTHTRTIFAIPEIEFTQQLKLLKELNEETTAHIMYSPVSFDWQEPGSDYTRGE